MGIGALNYYLTANALLAVAAVLAWGISVLGRRFRASFRHQLALVYVLLGAALALPLVGAWRRDGLVKPAAQLWSAPTMKGWAAAPVHRQYLSTAAPLPGARLPLADAGWLLVAALVSGGACLAYRSARDAVLLRRLLAGAQPVRRRGRLRLLATSGAAVPFSFWLPGRYYIVVPATLLVRPQALKLAWRHEAQHHRHQDTKLLYLHQVVKALFCLNPAVRALDHLVTELQEFACDEAVVGRRGISAQAYCRCLLWVAESASQRSRPLVGTASMASDAGTRSLKRRIEAMLKGQQVRVGRRSVLAAGTLGLGLMVTAAFAASAPVHDRRITLEEAQRLAATAGDGDGDGFPIVVNELVLDQLNRYLGTPDGRDYIKGSLAQMSNYRDATLKTLGEYRLPAELLAVPIVESGYRNRPNSDNPSGAAGIWQFMPRTARNFGMRVDDRADDRLDVPTETDAAARLLASLNLQFKDWGLALLAYNGGKGLVERGVQETGSRDVWDLVRRGYENDPHYVAAVMAAVLILKNPSSLDQ